MINKKTVKQKGFLLLEALIAITILSIGLVLIIRSFTNSLYAAKLSKDYMAAISYIEEKLEELDKTEIVSTQANTTSSFQIKTTTTVLITAPPIAEEEQESTSTTEQEEQKKIEIDTLEATISWKTKRKIETFMVSTYLKKKPETITNDDEEVL